MPSVAACIGPKQGSSISHWALQDLRHSLLWIQNCTVCSLEDCKVKPDKSGNKTARSSSIFALVFCRRVLCHPNPTANPGRNRVVQGPLAEVPKMDTENFLSSMQPVDSGSTLWWYAAKASSLQVIINYIIQYKSSIRTTSKKGMLTFWHLNAVKNTSYD